VKEERNNKECKGVPSIPAPVAIAVYIMFSLLLVFIFGYVIASNCFQGTGDRAYEIDFQKGSRYGMQPFPISSKNIIGEDGDGSIYQFAKQEMTSERVFFDLKTQYQNLEKIDVRVRYRGNPKELFLGFQQSDSAQYLYLPIHNRDLNELDWDVIEENGLMLFQRQKVYNDISSFVDDAVTMQKAPSPDEGAPQIASYNYETSPPPGGIEEEKINEGSIVDATLRGTHTFYVYVKGEPMQLTFDRQDINWDVGEDSLEIKVSHQGSLLYSRYMFDDGDVTASKIPSQPKPESVYLDGLQEGVYKVDLICGNDVAISSIRSDQKYLIFPGSVFIVNNHDAYSMFEDKSMSVFLDGANLLMAIYHPESRQTVKVDGNIVRINDETQQYQVDIPDGLHQIDLQKGDITLRSEGGMFSFEEDSMFGYAPLKTVAFDITTLDTAGYVLAGYEKPTEDGVWLEARLEIDASNLRVADGRIGLVFYAPKINAPIELGDVEIVVTGKN
jgi:hypothetical protein